MQVDRIDSFLSGTSRRFKSAGLFIGLGYGHSEVGIPEPEPDPDRVGNSLTTASEAREKTAYIRHPPHEVLDFDS